MNLFLKILLSVLTFILFICLTLAAIIGAIFAIPGAMEDATSGLKALLMMMSVLSALIPVAGVVVLVKIWKKGKPQNK